MIVPGPALENEGAIGVHACLIKIVQVFQKRARSDATFKNALLSAYSRFCEQPRPPRCTPEHDRFYGDLFDVVRQKLSPASLEPQKNRTYMVSLKDVGRVRKRFDHLGLVSKYAPEDNENDIRAWDPYFQDVTTKAKDFIPTVRNPDGTGKSEEFSDAKSVLDMLQSNGCAAIVGDLELGRRLAEETTKKLGWREIHFKPSDWIKSGPKGLWIRILCRLTDQSKQARPGLLPTIKAFISRWESTEQNLSESEFTSKLRSTVEKATEPLWSVFCKLIHDYGLLFQEPDLIADVAAIVRQGVGKALVVIYEAPELTPTQKTLEALVHTPNQQKSGAEIRLLVTSADPNVFSFFGAVGKKCTHLLPHAASKVDSAQGIETADGTDGKTGEERGLPEAAVVSSSTKVPAVVTSYLPVVAEHQNLQITRSAALCAMLKSHFRHPPFTNERGDILCKGFETNGELEVRYNSISFLFHAEFLDQDNVALIKHDKLLELVDNCEQDCVFLLFFTRKGPGHFRIFYSPASKLLSNVRVRQAVKRSRGILFNPGADAGELTEWASGGDNFHSAMRLEAEWVLPRQRQQATLWHERKSPFAFPPSILMTDILAVPRLEIPVRFAESMRDKNGLEIEGIIRRVVLEGRPRDGSPFGEYLRGLRDDLSDVDSRDVALEQFWGTEFIKFLSHANNGNSVFHFPKLNVRNAQFFRALVSKFPEEGMKVIKMTAALSTDKTDIMYIFMLAATLVYSDYSKITNEAAWLISDLAERFRSTTDYELYRERQKALLDSGIGDIWEAINFIRRYASSDREHLFLSADRYDWLRDLDQNLIRKLYYSSTKDQNGRLWTEEMARGLRPKRLWP